MTEMEEQVEYIVPNTVYEQLVTMALREIPGVAGTRGRGIVVRRAGEALAVEVHIAGYFGANLEQLALTVPQHVSTALETMGEPESLAVQVTIEDLVLKEK